MKIYLIVVLLLVGQSIAYRYLNATSFPLFPPPQYITSIGPNLIVAQTDKIIQIYNTQTNLVQQTFQSDTADPNPQVAGQFNVVLFKNNGSVFQMQAAQNALTLNSNQTGQTWIYPFGLGGDTLVAHQLDPVNGGCQITYLSNISSNYSKDTFEYFNPEQNIFAGSRVSIISPSQYYFVSGGVCRPDNNQHYLTFFKGDQTDIKVQNLIQISASCTLDPFKLKQQIYLSTYYYDSIFFQRYHAIAYKSDPANRLRTYTTQIIYVVQEFSDSIASFDVERLIGIDYNSSNLYSADNLLCRVLQHYPLNYKDSYGYPIQDFQSVKTVLAFDESSLFMFSADGTAYNFEIDIFSGKFTQKRHCYSTGPQAFRDGSFYGNYSGYYVWILWERKSSTLYQFSYVSTGSTYQSTCTPTNITNVVAQCITTGQFLFTVQTTNNTYYLHLNTLQILPSGDVNIIRGANVVLTSNVTQLLCLNNQTVLVVPQNVGQSYTTYQISGSNIVRSGSLIKQADVHNQISITNTSIIFLNSGYDSTLVYNFRLIPISVNIQPLLPPNTVYSIFTTPYSSDIAFAIGSDVSELVSLQYYTFQGSSISYQGSFPLINDGVGNYINYILMPLSGRISIEYGPDNHFITYSIKKPPQQLRGHFYDSTLIDCSGYTDALFRYSNITRTNEMIVINGLGLYPIIEKYTFTDVTVPLLSLGGSLTLTKYFDDSIDIQFDETKQNLLIYGIKQNPTNVQDTVSIRNIHNLDSKFQQSLFPQKDPAELQAFGFFNNYLVTAVTNKTSSGSDVNLTLNTTSQGRVSTGSTTPKIDLFATCSQCSFIAIATNGSQLVQLVSLVTGLARVNISTQCAVVQLSLSADGSKLAYLCSDIILYQLYVYDNNKEQTYLLTEIFTLSNLYFLSNSIVVYEDLGTIYKQPIQNPVSLHKPRPNRPGRESVPLATQNVLITTNSDNTLIAISTDQISVKVQNAAGVQQGYFSLNPGQSIVGLAFDTVSQLIVTTNDSKIITLSPNNCNSNFYIDNRGYCVCNGGYYYVSPEQCSECSVMCSKCDGPDIGNCDGYSAVFFVVIIVPIVVVLSIIGLVVFLKSRKKETVEGDIQEKLNKSGKGSQKSSQNITQRIRLQKQKEQNQER